MANELKLMIELEVPVPFTCADATGIEKGTLLMLSDPATVSKVSGSAPVVIGVAAEEKIANDGKTTIGVYMRGIFKAYAGGSITAGDSLIAENGTNEVLTGTTGVSGAKSFGVALETATDTESLLILFQAGTGGTPNA